MKTLMRNDDGAIAVIAAVLLSFAMLFISAIVVDAGFLYSTRSQLQSAADAGALEGCRVLTITGGDVAAATAAATQATMENAVGPGAGLTITAIQVNPADFSVRVVVSGNPNMYFSRRNPGGGAGPATRNVVAAARARRTLLTGGRYLVPWGIPIIENVDHVEARVGGVSYPLSASGGTTFEGDIPVPPGGGNVEIHVFNEYGVDEVLIDDAAAHPAPGVRLSEITSGYPFTEIHLSDDYIESNAYTSPTLTVRTAQPQTSLRAYVDRSFVSMTNLGGGTLWACTLPTVPVNNDLMTSWPIDVSVGNRADGNVDAYLHVRRSTNPFLEVRAEPLAVPAGGTSHVTVDLSYFDPEDAVAGRTYTLRVGAGDNLSGNFCEVRYDTIVHQATCPPDPVDPGSGNQYYDWVVEGYPGGVHVGDIITTSPGGSGINTQRALQERMDAHPGEDLIVEVPIVQKYEDKTGGTYELIVLKFASFRLTGTGDRRGNIEGEFIQYIANPSTYGSGPGGTTAIYAPRLINP